MIHCYSNTQLLTTFIHVTTFTFIFFFLEKKTLKLARRRPYHMDNVVKRCVLGWQTIISLK
jgi:hypothetical protein